MWELSTPIVSALVGALAALGGTFYVQKKLLHEDHTLQERRDRDAEERNDLARARVVLSATLREELASILARQNTSAYAMARSRSEYRDSGRLHAQVYEGAYLKHVPAWLRETFDRWEVAQRRVEEHWSERANLPLLEPHDMFSEPRRGEMVLRLAFDGAHEPSSDDVRMAVIGSGSSDGLVTEMALITLLGARPDVLSAAQQFAQVHNTLLEAAANAAEDLRETLLTWMQE